MTSNFSFTRNPSTKVRVKTELLSLAKIDNTLVLIGRMAAAGTTATANVPYTVENFGDSLAAKAECEPLFGVGSECVEMVVAAIDAINGSDLEPKAYPVIKVIPMANADTDLAATLAANINMPMPFVVMPFGADVSARLTELRTHVEAISGEDKGRNGQFGSFGFAALDVSTGSATPVGVGAASKNIMIPWLRDSAGTKKNKLHEVASAVAAICATNAAPYLPLNEVEIGGLEAPDSAADWHGDGDTGTCALGLSAGLIPLMVNHRGKVCISRTVTTLRSDAAQEDVAYYDMQDWQKLYAFRSNVFSLARQPRYKRAHASDAKLKALKSEIIVLAKTFESLEMFQYVDKLAEEFVVARDPANRHAGVYTIPLNVVPGFHNKGIELIGTNKFDSFIL
jgi:phage tail sheath gpL-like